MNKINGNIAGVNGKTKGVDEYNTENDSTTEVSEYFDNSNNNKMNNDDPDMETEEQYDDAIEDDNISVKNESQDINNN